MSNLDERIRKALADDENRTLASADDDLSIMQTIGETFRGRHRYLVGMVYVVTLAYAAAMVWAGYRFFSAETTTDIAFYGILMLAALACVTAHKFWYWMEMNRVTLMRELKRVELQLAELRRNGG